jgi:hypothetical protein
VSRFHGYFQQDRATRVWSLVDAESQNGTFRGSRRLAPNQPVPLFEHAELRLGGVEISFYSLAELEKLQRRGG